MNQVAKVKEALAVMLAAETEAKKAHTEYVRASQRWREATAELVRVIRSTGKPAVYYAGKLYQVRTEQSIEIVDADFLVIS